MAYLDSLTKGKMSIDDFCSHLFEIRDAVHILHLKNKSYAQHMALNDLYDFMVEIADDLIETAQTEKLLNIKTNKVEVGDNAEEYVKKELAWIRANRSIFPYSFQQNILDTVEENISKTLYKLKFLK